MSFTRTRTIAHAAAALFLAGCAGVADAPTAPSAVDANRSQPAARCLNVAADAVATLGFPVVLPNGTAGAGAQWFPVTLGGISGEMASVLLSETVSGSKGQGARHWTLQHAFRTASGDYFITTDRAVCAPAGQNPAVCRVNDVLTVTAGTGIFAGAGGSLRNHAVIDFAAGTLVSSLRGRVCGAGL